MAIPSLNNEKDGGERDNFIPNSWILVLFHSGFHYETQVTEAPCKSSSSALKLEYISQGKKIMQFYLIH